MSRLSQYFAEPTEEQWVTVKHILRYLKGTAEKGLSFRRNDCEKLGKPTVILTGQLIPVTDAVLRGTM